MGYSFARMFLATDSLATLAHVSRVFSLCYPCATVAFLCVPQSRVESVEFA